MGHQPKGTDQPKIKNRHFILLPELLSLGDIGRLDVWLLLNVMEMDGTWLVVLKATKKT